MRHIFLSATLVLASFSVVRADEPEKPFAAPPPQAVVPKIMPYYLAPSLPKPGTREVWQYYGVDNRGRWVPRVILSPSGAYYYYNGAPFRYTTTQPHLYMPYVVD